MLRGTGMTYFQVPHCFFKEQIVKVINKTSMILYVFLLSQSEKYSKLSLKYSNKALSEQTWLANTQVIAARQQLIELGLIQAEKVGGGYEYTLCDPDSGKAIPNQRLKSKGYDFDKMTADDNKAYFLKRLWDNGVDDFSDTNNGIKAVCPLCRGSRQTFEVKLSDGRWHCHKCEQKGRHIHFEECLAAVLGDPVTRTEARRRVVDTLPQAGVTDAATLKPEAVYAYTDEQGEVLVELCR